MNPEVRDRWTTALRSEEYPQGTNYLKRINLAGATQYCCFGVLAELCEVPEKRPGQEGPNIFTFRTSIGPIPEMHAPPREWCESLGIPVDIRNRLMDMNDATGDYSGNESMTFSEIADWIDEYL